MTRRESIEHMLKINLEDTLDFLQDGLYNSACTNRSMEDCGDDRDCDDCREAWLDTEITDDAAKQVLNWLEKHKNDTLDITINFPGMFIHADMRPIRKCFLIADKDGGVCFYICEQHFITLTPLFCYANQQTLRVFTEEGSVVFIV